MAAWSNLVVIISMDLHPIRLDMDLSRNHPNRDIKKWIYTQFDQAGIQCKGFRCRLISMDLHPIRLVKFDQSTSFNRQCNLNGFTPNSTGHKLLVKLGGNSLRFFLCHDLGDFVTNPCIRLMPGRIWWS